MKKRKPLSVPSDLIPSKLSKPRRRPIRYHAEQDLIAMVSKDLRNKSMRNFLTALPVDESHKGVGLVMLERHNLSEGDFVLIKVGQLNPLIGMVRWVKKLDHGLVRLGVEYSE